MIVADTSALVSLATGDALDVTVAAFDVATTRVVTAELDETAAYDDDSGTAAQQALDYLDSMTVRDVDVPDVGSDRIDEGEASCVALARETEADFLITDDLRALPELQALTDARVAISPIVLKALVKRDQLPAHEVRDKLDDVAETRSWLGAPIYRRAQELFSE